MRVLTAATASVETSLLKHKSSTSISTFGSQYLWRLRSISQLIKAPHCPSRSAAKGCPESQRRSPRARKVLWFSEQRSVVFICHMSFPWLIINPLLWKDIQSSDDNKIFPCVLIHGAALVRPFPLSRVVGWSHWPYGPGRFHLLYGTCWWPRQGDQFR